jgi:hypothetical protein
VLSARRVRLPSRWVRLTDETNALDYLERAGSFIRETEDNPFAWKWVVLALHGALYGFAVSACKGTDYETVVRRTKKGAERLVSLDAALQMCKDEAWMGTLHGGLPLKLSASQEDSIRRLKQTLRNRFEHYRPGVWSIEIHGLPQIAIDVLDVISFLGVGTFRYQHLNESQRRRVRSIVYRSKKLLRSSSLHREASMAEDPRAGRTPQCSGRRSARR